MRTLFQWLEKREFCRRPWKRPTRGSKLRWTRRCHPERESKGRKLAQDDRRKRKKRTIATPDTRAAMLPVHPCASRIKLQSKRYALLANRLVGTPARGYSPEPSSGRSAVAMGKG